MPGIRASWRRWAEPINDDSTAYIYNNEAAVKALELYGEPGQHLQRGQAVGLGCGRRPIVALASG